MKMMVTSFKRSHAGSAAGHHRSTPPLETLGHSRASLGQSLVGSLFLSPVSGTNKVFLCPPRVCFPSPVQVLAALCWR